jgi:hypothetical protein
MSDEKVESPVIEAPVVPEPKPPEIDKESLLSELTKMGVRKPEEIVGMHQASREAGKLANMLGEVRNENAELKRMIQQMQQSTSAGYQSETPGVDLGQLIESKTETAVQRAVQRISQQQIEAQRTIRAEQAKIQNNKWFPAVKDVFEKYISNPNVQDRLMSGESTLTDEYRNVVDAYVDKMMQAQQNALSATQKPKPPHVEQGDSQSVQKVPESDETKKKLRRISEERSKGNLESNKALDMLVKELFPAERFNI